MSTNTVKNFYLTETQDSLTGHLLQTWRHSSGFMLKLLPRPRFSRCFAAVTVPFGSIHADFRVGERDYSVPAGSAHFLEHCIFSRDEEGGLLGGLSRLGASANAYTTHTHTMYYFSTTGSVVEPLNKYLRALLKPDISPARIEAERPVILAELDMYRDDPDSRLFSDLLELLYAKHPVRIDVGGTHESVSAITEADLRVIVDHYYHPSSLSLTIAGDVEADKILRLLEPLLPTEKIELPLAVPVIEQPLPLAADNVRAMDVRTASFLVGIKDPLPGTVQLQGRALAARQRAGRLVFDTLLSEASNIHETLLNEGLIHDSFSAQYTCDADFGFAVAGGESEKPEQAGRRLIELLVSQWNAGLDAKLFNIQKRAAAGDFLRALDSIDYSGMVQARCNLYPVDLFDYPLIYDKIELADLRESFAFIGNPESYSLSIVNPLGGQVNVT